MYLELGDKVKLLRNEITQAYSTGYYLLQQANISTGIISNLANQVTVENTVKLTYRSVMGVEIPTVKYTPNNNVKIDDIITTKGSVYITNNIKNNGLLWQRR